MRKSIAALMIAGAAALAGCASQPQWTPIYCTPAYPPDYTRQCVYERTG